MRAHSLEPRPVASSLEELLAGATRREPFMTSDSKSGSAFERVVIDGESLIVKHVHIDDDWTMRFNGDVGCHPAQVWRAGLVGVVPARVLTVIDELRRDPSSLVDAAGTTPLTFLHGDWKLGNVGLGSDGRTVLIDWTYPGEGPCCFDLAWYLALNRVRIPEGKEEAIARFRRSLEGHGIVTNGW